MEAINKIPIHQSKYGWRAGSRKKQTTESGTAIIIEQAPPSAAILTASSPFPSRQSAWAGSTARDVSASGTPKKVLGTESTNVWVMRAANIALARIRGAKKDRKKT